MAENKKNVLVLFGGKSPEHEISIITGVQVIKNINSDKYNVIPVYVAKDGSWYYRESFNNIDSFKNLEVLPLVSTEVYLSANPNNKYLTSCNQSFFSKKLKIKIDVIFPCFHGGVGENGSFQGLFEITEIPYVGSEVLGSSLGMDKVACKDILRANNINTADYLHFNRVDITTNLENVVMTIEAKFHYPIFVKPAVGGSSVGITKAKDRNSLTNGLELAAMFDSKVIVEKSIENVKEINISVIGNSTGELRHSVCEEVFHSGEFLSYDDKYKGQDGKSQGMASTKRQIPAVLTEESLNVIQETAKKTFKCLNCYGLVRIDFLVKENPLEIYVIEVNTIPGSMAFYLWEKSNLSFAAMISKLIELAEIRSNEKMMKTQTFSTNILQSFKTGIKTSKF